MPINIPQVPFKLSPEDMGITDLGAAFQKGVSNYYRPQQLAEDLLKSQLANKISSAKAKYAEQQELANIDYKNALTKHAMQLANQPMGGGLAGPAKEAYALELIKGRFGEDSPVYQNALSAYNANVKSKESLADYRGNLAGTAEQRALTSFGKLQHEENDVLSGYEPGTRRQVRISPERQQELLGQYALQRQKMSSDTDARKKVLYATNIDKTIERINPQDLTRFGGIGGQIELKKQEGLSAANKPTSKEFEKYKQAEANAKLLAKQVRQFYGDSIQPSVSAKLEALTNPATWRNNPKIASQIYDSFVRTLKSETETYKSALGSPGAYKGSNSSKNDPLGIR